MVKKLTGAVRRVRELSKHAQFTRPVQQKDFF